jgi:hypothetical protein
MDDESVPICTEYLSLKSFSDQGRLVGFYTQRERRNKINQLRQKLMRRKIQCPINKIYKGRSKAARSKARFQGKFVKGELAEKYSVDDTEFLKRNDAIEKHLREMDYQKTVNVLTEY